MQDFRKYPENQGVSGKLRASLLAGYKKPEDLIGASGLFKPLTKRLVKKAPRAIPFKVFEKPTSSVLICTSAHQIQHKFCLKNRQQGTDLLLLDS